MSHITVHETQHVIRRDDVILIDVREPAEYAAVHIEQATLAPLSKLNEWTLPTGITRVIVHCKSGMRAEKAIKQLQRTYPEIEFSNMQYGIDGWQKAGLTVNQSQQAGLLLDRQVQITIGSLVLIGSVLGYVHHPLWFALSAFFGAGLLFSGVTGTCALALMMARMPWNQS